MWRKFSLWPSIILSVLMGCQTEHVENNLSSIGSDYFPLKVGTFRVYNVQDIEYTFPDKIDTIGYQLKETITDSIINLEGTISYILNRQKKLKGTSEWQQDSVWTDRKDTHIVVQTENNIPIIKMVFPVEEGKTWDANGFNDSDEDLYSLEKVDLPYTDQTSNYNQTVTVVQEDFNDGIIKKDERKEIYGKNIGLIYKESVILNYCTDISCQGEQIIETGRDFRMRLVDYGQN